jgi:hypothetical protein
VSISTYFLLSFTCIFPFLLSFLLSWLYNLSESEK